MTVQQLIDTAVNTELKQLSLKNDVDTVLSYMNLGLIELYKKFPLKTDEAIINLVDGVTTYKLDNTDPNVSMGNTEYMWVIAAYGETSENSNTVNVLPINSEDNPISINTVGYNQLQIPLSTDGARISIIYTASPKYYTTSDLSEVLPIPPQMIEALLEYIGYRGHKSIDTERAEAYFQKFELSCSEIDTKGMFNTDDLNMSKRLSKRGFV